jgi:hypothetical protein
MSSSTAYIYGEVDAAEDIGASDWLSQRDDKTSSQAPVQLRPKFKALMVNTLLSEVQLNNRGLLLHPHESETWLIDIDADTLTGRPRHEQWQDLLIGRFNELRELAAEEGLPFSEKSAAYALQFALKIVASVRPGAFLLGNGNVRLLWSRKSEQIGLQFLTDGSVQFVLFASRGDRIATLMGDDGSGEILRHISSAGLRHLLED